MRRYLIVDDNVAFAENLAEIVRDDGAEVAVAADGAQALALVRTTRFDALVTDMRMPVMGGARLVHEIRFADPGLPALVVTAYTGADELLAARQEGLLAVLPKPAPLPRLLELLRRARRDGLVALVEDDPAMADNLAEALRDRGFSAVTARSVSEVGSLGGIRPFEALVDNLSQVLAEEGYEVRTASTGAEAIEHARPGFEVALVDVRLPDTEGTELAERRREISPERG